ncbi:MAG: ribosomal protein S18 acetylase RimI-like enzyme [Candidatus Azotimanducaceae bacterium]|jgi:ribosomal protein S18 acetylase RimI-like enzyme
MQIIAATEELKDTFSNDIPELVWATGPVSYDYHFADRNLFDAVVLGSWHQNGTLFAADATTLAVENGELMGIEIGMPGSEFKSRQNALGSVWTELVDKAQIDADDIAGVLQRSEYASWLNPEVQADTYYIHALSVKPEFRGKRVGYQLMDSAINVAVEKGFAKLQLDVLSDNLAVEFYRAVGFEILADTRAPKPSAFGVPPEYRMGLIL